MTAIPFPERFQYPLNLHCSQTNWRCIWIVIYVSIPSEFTLLSNTGSSLIPFHLVSIPSEFTLLSNYATNKQSLVFVSIPSEFTLLSNMMRTHKSNVAVSIPSEFTLLSNTPTVSLQLDSVSIPSEFTLLSNLKFQILTYLRINPARLLHKFISLIITHFRLLFQSKFTIILINHQSLFTFFKRKLFIVN